MMMINSSPSSQTDSAKRLRLTLPRNNHKADLLTQSNSISPGKLDEKSHPLQKKSIDCNSALTTMKQQASTAVDNENDTTLLTTTTTTTTVEVKVKTTKTSSSSSQSSSRKRKLPMVDDTINTSDNNNDNINKQQQQQQQEQPVSKKKKKQRSTNSESHTGEEPSTNGNSDHQVPPKTVDQSSVTDESSFGSCEPGTNVVLQGIVWNETDKGVLVVNITWRGKTYVGALLNTTEQNWAPPRYKSDVRPTKHNRHNHHHNHNRDYLLTSTSSSSSTSQSALHLSSTPNSSSTEPTERILRNGKRRGTYTTVTPSTSASSKGNSFKIPEAPPSKSDEALTTEKLTDTGSGAPSSSSTSVNDEDETNSMSGEKTLVRNGVDDETGDNCSSRSVSPTTSGASTTSSSPPPSIQEKPISEPQINNLEQSTASIPMDLSNSRTTIKTEDNLVSYNSVVQTSSPSKSMSSSSSPSFLSSFTNKPSKSKAKDFLSTPPSLLSAHPFNNGLLFSSPGNPASYYPPAPPSFLHGPPHSFGLSPFHPHHHSPAGSLHSNTNKNKLSPPLSLSSSSSAVSPSSYLTIPSQLYFNPLTAPRFPSVCSSSPSSSLSKSSR